MIKSMREAEMMTIIKRTVPLPPNAMGVSRCRGDESMDIYSLMNYQRLGFDSRRGKIFFSSLYLNWFRVPPSGHRELSPWGLSGRTVKLTTHLHLVLKLRIRGSVLPLPHTSS
jgi:hypothetical protein